MTLGIVTFLYIFLLTQYLFVGLICMLLITDGIDFGSFLKEATGDKTFSN